jgi:phosphonopyruvate decarboxylase
MIEAASFVECARKSGFDFYAGVPCSYLKPFINYVADDTSLQYVSAANEGDAVAVGAGAVLGGRRAVAMMQNSGLGNAVSPLSSLNWVFRLPVMLIITLRGDPVHGDEPQHELMGTITQQMLDVLDIPWELFPDEEDQVAGAVGRAVASMDREQRPFAFVMRKDSVSPYQRQGTGIPDAGREVGPSEGIYLGSSPTRREVLERIVELSQSEDTVLIASTGYTGRELYAIGDRDNQLYVVGSMGCASSLGLGLSLARPDKRVVVIDGDGAGLMRMGNFATLGRYGGGNLLHVLLDNEMHESTGGQDTVSDTVSFAGVAEACGYAVSLEGDNVDLLDSLFDISADGPQFAQVKTCPGTSDDLPRPTVTPVQVKERLMGWLRD